MFREELQCIFQVKEKVGHSKHQTENNIIDSLIDILEIHLLFVDGQTFFHIYFHIGSCFT